MRRLLRGLAAALAVLVLVEVASRGLRDGTGLVRGSQTEVGRRLAAQDAGLPFGDALTWHPRWGWQPADEPPIVGEGPRVVVLGDAQVVGAWLDGAGGQRVDLSVRGFGADQALLRFVEVGLRLEPAVVVIVLDQASLERVRRAWTMWRKPRFGFEGRLTAPEGNAPRPEVAAREGAWLAAVDLLTWAGEALTEPAGLSGPDDPWVRAVLDGLGDEIAALGARRVVVWAPSPGDADGAALVRAWAPDVVDPDHAAQAVGALVGG